MTKIIRILRSCSMKISTVNISKHNYWLLICIAKNLIWTTLKVIFSIFRFFCTLRFQIYKYCPNHTSMEILFTPLTDSKMTGFMLQGHICSSHDSVLCKYFNASLCFCHCFFRSWSIISWRSSCRRLCLTWRRERKLSLTPRRRWARILWATLTERARRAGVFLTRSSALDAAAAARASRRARVQPARAAGRRQASARGLRSPGGAGEVEGQAAGGSTGSAATAGKHELWPWSLAR